MSLDIDDEVHEITGEIYERVNRDRCTPEEAVTILGRVAIDCVERAKEIGTGRFGDT